tara:strand:- start:8295 stop:10550 length:2256 start_codon:yes stop_codon:yes gene_type:complete
LVGSEKSFIEVENNHIHKASQRFSSRIMFWLTSRSLGRKLAIALAVASVLSGIATYLAMTGAVHFGGPNNKVILLLNIDLVLLLLLGASVAVPVVRLWMARRRGSAGSRLHIRMVTLFSLVAIAPSIVVVIFSVLFLNFGLQAWFSKQVSTALEQSLVVAEAYVEEHREGIRADALAMAVDINRQISYISGSSSRFNQVVERLSELRSLTEAVVVTRNGRVIARDSLSVAFELQRVPESALQSAANGETVILSDKDSNRVRALVRLDGFVDAYLLIGRFIESRVINHMQRVQGAVGGYRDLEQKNSGIQITFVLIFIVVALLVLLVSVWMGLYFADRLVGPIRELIYAAERVRKGDSDVRVIEGDEVDELGKLSITFNKMTLQLDNQRQEILYASEQIDERRRFTEAVLSGVSAGVLGLDMEGKITLPNPSALRLLETKKEELIGMDIIDVIPEMSVIVSDARSQPKRAIEKQLDILRGDRIKTLIVRAVAESSQGDIIGYVLTFDDITPLVSAQRTAAWADVARRIAHEIKNPLTPIQLAAERLKRRYMKEIITDPEIFSTCTDTIIKHVGDIREMVDEFSSFARMPAPNMKKCILNDLVNQVINLQKLARPDLEILIEMTDKQLTVFCDKSQIRQALTNLLTNAVEAIDGRNDTHFDSPLAQGCIEVKINKNNEGLVNVIIQDNGRGLPPENRERLTEPYVTTRARGTGLGLAIVAKIIEDHGGELALKDSPSGGAIITFTIPQTKSSH